MAVSGMNDPYTILGVDRSAPDNVIAAAYRKLARTFHPDVAGDSATVEMMQINAAFDRIRDQKRRAEHAAEEEEDRADGRASRHDGSTSPRDTRGASADNGLDWAPERDGTGGAGKPPGRPSGSVLPFGRHIGWSLGEIARVDPGYLVWLEDRRDGRPYLEEIDRTLRLVGFRKATDPGQTNGGRLRR
jgi:curved DNA-binding protein CbpA